jgi:hypothetical protein
VIVSEYLKEILPYNEYYNYVIDAKRQFHYLACESWPEFGSEIYLQTIYSSKIHRSIVLVSLCFLYYCFWCNYGACLEIFFQKSEYYKF